jgi:hypothetical protein
MTKSRKDRRERARQAQDRAQDQGRTVPRHGSGPASSPWPTRSAPYEGIAAGRPLAVIRRRYADNGELRS